MRKQLKGSKPKAGIVPPVLAFLLLSAASFSTSAEYHLIDLGIDVSPTDINNQATIVGSRKTASGPVAFRLLSDGVIEDINGATVANAVNEFNHVTGITPLTPARGRPRESQEGAGGQSSASIDAATPARP